MHKCENQANEKNQNCPLKSLNQITANLKRSTDTWVNHTGLRPGLALIKLFSCSTQLSMKFQSWINLI